MIKLRTPSVKDSHSLTISKMAGIDTFNNPVSVSVNHAVDMRNIINENGINHKRNGWKEMAKYPSAIDGYYKYKKDGEWEIVYAGGVFYINKDGSFFGTYSDESLRTGAVRFFEHNGKVFIIGAGKFLVFTVEGGDYSVFPVADSALAYTPLTYIGDYHESKRGLKVLSVESSNMLSSLRINKFYDASTESEPVVYRLDVYTDEITDEPVIKDVQNTLVKWKNGFGKEEIFRIGFDNPAYYLFIPDNDDINTARNYRVEIEEAWYSIYLWAGSVDDPLQVFKSENYVYYVYRDEIHQASVCRDFNIKEAQLVPTGFYRTEPPRLSSLENRHLYFSGNGKLKNTPTGNVFQFYDKTRNSFGSLRWRHIQDTNIYVLNYFYDSEYSSSIYAAAERVTVGGYISYEYFSGEEELLKRFPDGIDGVSIDNFCSTFDFFSTYEFWSWQKDDYFTLRRDSDKKILHIYPYGYSLKTEEGEIIGSIDPHHGELAFSHYLEETWDGIGDEKIPTITVEYKTQNEEYKKLDGCTIGTLFGLNGNSDRLFLSGNPEYPNVDWHSGYTDEEGKQGNFCYFPTSSYAVLGSTQSEIKGYQRLSDGSMAIYKSRANNEATLYIRTGVGKTDSNGKIIEYYPNNGGYVAEGAISKDGFAVLGSDMLILSENGVFGLEISDNVASQQRFMKERSKPINKLLAKHNLSSAQVTVFKNRLYLAVDGMVYVADARYTRRELGDMGDTFSYEWYVWTNCPVKIWINDGSKLGFGTEEGRICYFGKGYVDYYVANKISNASLSLDRSFGLNALVINGNMEPSTDKSVNSLNYWQCLVKGLLGGYLGEWDIRFAGDAGTITYAGVDSAGAECFIRNMLQVGGNVYIASGIWNTDYDDGTAVGGRKITEIDYDTLTIKVEYRRNEAFMIDRNGISYTVEQKPPKSDWIMADIDECYMHRYDKYGNRFYILTAKPEALGFTTLFFKTVSTDVELTVYYQSSVIASWKTPTMNFGSDFYVKKLEKITALVEGSLKIGFETRTDNGFDLEIQNSGKPFDFNALDFGEIALSNLMDDENGVTICSKSVGKTFGTLILRFENDKDEDFIVHEITLIYKLIRKLKGVR